jgi:glucosamine--fructose-6-phosphate aminotransferase (isomerizing)
MGLRGLPAQAAETLRRAAPVRKLAQSLARVRDVIYIGRALGFPTAMEGALKLKELSYVHAEGYAAGELKHGPIALLDPETPLVAIATQGATYDKLVSNVAEARARTSPVIAVATEGDDAITRYAQDVLYVPETLEALAPILAILPLQLLAYEVAVARGTDVDQPRNLAKSVTVE